MRRGRGSPLVRKARPFAGWYCNGPAHRQVRFRWLGCPRPGALRRHNGAKNLGLYVFVRYDPRSKCGWGDRQHRAASPCRPGARCRDRQVRLAQRVSSRRCSVRSGLLVDTMRISRPEVYGPQIGSRLHWLRLRLDVRPAGLGGFFSLTMRRPPIAGPAVLVASAGHARQNLGGELQPARLRVPAGWLEQQAPLYRCSSSIGHGGLWILHQPLHQRFAGAAVVTTRWRRERRQGSSRAGRNWFAILQPVGGPRPKKPALNQATETVRQEGAKRGTGATGNQRGA